MGKILITGGAGFVGSQLARQFHESGTGDSITVFDNLKRRGSELNLADFKKRGIRFVHGDIRNPQDFSELTDHFDLMVEASAEPSVLAGTQGSPDYVIYTNLLGTYHCLEFARKQAGSLIFLSTSRVYSIPSLTGLPFQEKATRLEPDWNRTESQVAGLSAKGINEQFSTSGVRSFYGSSKLASELLAEEYAHQYKLPTVINRCGVIAGAGQFGKADQGVFTLWVAHHYFGKPLKYTGFGGKGKQVRDLIHTSDLFSLMQKQISQVSSWRADVFNVGGGPEGSVSLFEYTRLCEEVTGKKLVIDSSAESASVDIPWYVTDSSKVMQRFGWSPQVAPVQIVKNIFNWLRENEDVLKNIFT